MGGTRQVDVAINYYGKPFQTMVTIASLLEHSGDLIDQIYLIKEPKQPEGGEEIVALLNYPHWNVRVFTPRVFFGWREPRKRMGLQAARRWLLLRSAPIRHSIRYQYALEKSDKRYVFLTHNDMLFTGDVISVLLDAIKSGDYVAAGDVGACWKCPFGSSGICRDRQPHHIEVTYSQAVELYKANPSEHRSPTVSELDPLRPVPPPECRLNEWFALVDTDVYRREVVPHGSAEPLGSFKYGDVGIAWFRQMLHRGYRIKHVAGPYLHTWASSEHGGHGSLFDHERYVAEESIAERHLKERYGISTSN